MVGRHMHHGEVLEQIYVRTHARMGGSVLDVGALAEACVFYGSVNLVLGRGSLRQLLGTYGSDALLEFLREGVVRPYYMHPLAGVYTEGANTTDERHQPLLFSVDRDLESDVVSIFREATGRSGAGRRRAKRFLDIAPAIALDPGELQLALDQTFADERLMRASVDLTAREALPNDGGPRAILRSMRPTGDGFYAVDLGAEWSAFKGRFERERGVAIGKADLLSHVLESTLDLQLAARLECEISTSDLGSSLLAQQTTSLAERVLPGRQQQLSPFQNHVLRGRDIRAAVNSGARDLQDVQQLVLRGRRFRQWVDGLPMDADLIGSYLDEVTAETWASNLPARVVRFTATTSLGMLLAGPLGAAASVALGVFDEFVLDRLARGWRPNHFVDKDLDAFLGTDRNHGPR